MASNGKVLKTSVRLDAKQALKTLDQLQKKLNAIQTATDRVTRTSNNMTSTVRKQNTATNQATTAMNKNANAAKNMANSNKQANVAVKALTRNLAALASTYLGLMGARAVVNTSDTITASENRLNALNGGNTQMTQNSMDKMYTSAQKVRMNYADMMSNVSKSMTLAGKSFNDNIDNAIRFQEIMSEAYTLGGASAAEKSSSMYQMIQALGAGTLAGDELRSVREGAPLAYKAIEEFAQGVLNTTDSLKDLASQGKITSDMVVAAIMDAGEKMDEQFKKTSMTFAEAGNIIKNSAIKSFEPALQKLNDLLNSDSGRAFIDGLTKAFQVAGAVASKLIDIIQVIVDRIVANWYWIQPILLGGLLGLGIYAIITGYRMLTAFLLGLSPLSQACIIISAVVAALIWMGNVCGTVCNFIYTLAMAVAQAVIAILLVVFVVYMTTHVMMMSVESLHALFVIGIIALLLAAFVMFAGQIIGAVYGVWSVIQAICFNISAAWQNMCSGMAAWFWDAIANMLEGVEWLLKGINKIREALGKDAITVEGIRAKASAARSSGGVQYKSLSDAWSSGYSKGYGIGEGIQNKINSWGDALKTDLTSFDITDELNLTDLPNATLNADDYGDKLDDIANGTGNTAGNTGKMADALDLAEEDLEYLRKLAELEWKKEYTTNTITVDMSNYNTINSDSDLDGIVTKLTDKLYEELEFFADGVYA